MPALNKRPLLHHAGFSLVEILVGLVIGLLATLVIMQVFSVFEGQKRTTTGTADAQTNGSIALHTIDSEIHSAAFDLLPFGDPGIADSAIECPAPNISAPAAAAGVTSLSPVTITDGGAGSDSITIRYGSSSMAGIPAQIGFVNLPNARIKNGLGCPVGVAVTLPNCLVTTVTGVQNNLHPVTGLPESADVTLSYAVGVAGGQNLVCLGTWNEVTFTINANNLARNATPVVSDIVNIQAQYGISAGGLPNTDPNFNQITQWVNATGAWAAPATVDRNRIKAVRIAVVARNGLMEKTAVTQPCTTAKGTANNGPCAWDDSNVNAAPAIDLSGDVNWQQYRYRVFETIVPVRTVIWSKGTL